MLCAYTFTPLTAREQDDGPVDRFSHGPVSSASLFPEYRDFYRTHGLEVFQIFLLRHVSDGGLRYPRILVRVLFLERLADGSDGFDYFFPREFHIGRVIYLRVFVVAR